MTLAFSLIIFLSIYLAELFFSGKKPNLFRYFIFFIIFFSYQYLSACDTCNNKYNRMDIEYEEFDQEEEWEEFCYPLTIEGNVTEYIKKKIEFFNMKAEFCLKRAQEETIKIEIPEQKTFVDNTIGVLIAAVVASDSRARLVGMCLVVIADFMKKSVCKYGVTQHYLLYAEQCYMQVEFYEQILKRYETVDSCLYRKWKERDDRVEYLGECSPYYLDKTPHK